MCRRSLGVRQIRMIAFDGLNELGPSITARILGRVKAPGKRVALGVALGCQGQASIQGLSAGSAEAQHLCR